MLRSHRLFIILILLIYLMVIIMPLSYGSYPETYIKWIMYNNPTTGDDIPLSICLYGNYLYVVGYDSGNGDSRLRIEKRFMENGSLVEIWTYNPSNGMDWFIDCVVINDSLYVIGFDNIPGGSDYRWVLVVLDQDLNMNKYIAQNITDYDDWALSISSDGSYLYIAGYMGDNYRLRLEKRRISDLEIVAVYTSNEEEYSIPYFIAINPITNHIWVAGFVYRYAIWWWKIKILDEHFNVIGSIDPEIAGGAFGIAFDEYGYAYIVGDYGIIKLNVFGDILTKRFYGICRKILYYNGHIYTVCNDYEYRFTRHILYVLDRELNLVNRVILSQAISVDSRFPMGKMATDGKYIYVAGYDYAENNEQWVIYSLNIDKISRPREITITITEAKTITMPITITTKYMDTITIYKTLYITNTETTSLYKTLTIAITQEKTHTYTLLTKQIETLTIASTTLMTQTVSVSVTITSTEATNYIFLLIIIIALTTILFCILFIKKTR